mmetsp:Transcript_4558/g.8844  ORF Transcript_4558/g.8844 Transcript_4558/m.8844 type:complete len:244 (+) Transcript_4558:1784-2515(+)
MSASVRRGVVIVIVIIIGRGSVSNDSRDDDRAMDTRDGDESVRCAAHEFSARTSLPTSPPPPPSFATMGPPPPRTTTTSARASAGTFSFSSGDPPLSSSSSSTPATTTTEATDPEGDGASLFAPPLHSMGVDDGNSLRWSASDSESGGTSPRATMAGGSSMMPQRSRFRFSRRRAIAGPRSSFPPVDSNGSGAAVVVVLSFSGTTTTTSSSSAGPPASLLLLLLLFVPTTTATPFSARNNSIV